MNDPNFPGGAPRSPFTPPTTPPPLTPPPPPPAYGPPIASPYNTRGQGPYMPNVKVSRDYKDAPKIVKSARSLAMLSVIGGALLCILPFASANHSSVYLALSLIQGAVYIGMGIWLSFGHYSGQPAAWVGQIVMSALGLLRIPIGTAIHAYLLSQWFSPEVKAWYGQ